MSEDKHFIVNCGTYECERPIAVLSKNIASVALLEGGLACVTASVAREADCRRVECGMRLAFAITDRPDSIAWLEANIDSARIEKF